MKQFYKTGAAMLALGLSCFTSWGQITTTFDYTGDVQTYVVPDGITLINIEAYGAEGGTAQNDSSTCIIGGLGGFASGDLSVTPGETLNIYVGGRGYAGDIGGWNGGGDACDNVSTCAKGGGASDVRQGGADLADRVIVAGGGGGAEWSGCSGGAGDGGGLSGADGAHPTTGARDGKGGTQIAGGAFGTGGYNGTAGTFGVGGAGGTHPAGHSGSGGGGWYGGGGSAEDGHAGGGSSYIDGVVDGVTTPGLQSGHGQIIITELCTALDVTVTDDEICFGEEVTFNATGGGAISWTDGVVNGEPFSPAETGDLSFVATSTDPMDCPYTVNLTVHALPEVTATADVTEICYGETITVTGGGADTYTWDPADIEDGVAYTPDETGEFTYTVTGTNETTTCTNEASVDVVVNDLPEVEAIASSEELCDGDELTLTGSGAVDYSWDMGVEDGVAFTPETGITTYTVVGTDDNGCEKETTVEVTVHELPEVTATADQDEVCFGAEVTLTGGGAETYVWDPAEVTDGAPYTTSMAGINTFTVTGTDANGCENSASVDVMVLDEIVVTYTTTDEIMGGDGAIDIDVTGGAPTYTFDWDNDGTGDFDDDEDLTDLTGGTYTVVVMDQNECTTTIEIEVNSQLGIGAIGITEVSVYPNPTDGQVTITNQGKFTYTVKSLKGDVLVMDTASDSETITLDEFADGVYYITVQSNEKINTFKVVKR